MPVPLEPADRKFLILAGSILSAVVIAGLVIAPPPAEPSTGSASSYSAASDGAKAAYLLLKDLGYSVERWERPATELPSQPEGTILILAEPLPLFSAEDNQAIHRFIHAGGRVLATGLFVAHLLPEGSAFPYEHPEPGWKQFRAVVPSPLARGAPEVTMSPAARWQMTHPGHVGIYADGADAVVVEYAVDKGQVIWWPSATPLVNAGIVQPGNLNLLLNSLGTPERTRVLWDEYAHGRRGSLWSYFSGTPLPWSLAQLGLFVLAVCATFARRNGPVRPPVTESRLSPLEFVETLGDLYLSAHAAAPAVSVAWQRFHYLLTRRLGLSSTAPVAELYSAVRERLGWKEPGFYETLQRAERGARNASLSGAEALQMVQALEHYAGLLQLKSRPLKEKSGWQNT